MDPASIIAIIGGLSGIITAIAVGLKYRAEAQSQDRKDALELATVQQKRIDQLTCRMTEMEKKSDLQDSEIEVLQLNNLELKEEIGSLRTENKSLKDEVVIVRRENAILKRENSELRGEIAELKEENQTLRDRLEVIENGESKVAP